MAFANPAIHPPRLPSPTKTFLHSRSPSRSPVRQHHPRDTDPVLRDLSPSAALRAFRNHDHAQDQLGKSLERATPAQRALGAQAAQACIDLRSWAREVASWDWPGTFEVPEPVRKKQQRVSSMSLGSLASGPSISTSPTQDEEEGEDDYCGSLPVTTVQRYERRLDEINESLEEMDVERLKDFVLSAHSQSSFGAADIDDSIGAIGADTNLRHLDDFTALITATILSALPFLSRLTRLLHTWHTRLIILRATPPYLHDLRQARTDLDHGWAALAVSKHPAAARAMMKSNATFTRDTMMDMKDVVSKQVHGLGRRLDRFLDELEGREETVPDRWIEEFEVLEEQYGSWVVQAERKVIEDEWAAARESLEIHTAAHADARELEESPETATTITVSPTITTAMTFASNRPLSMNTSTRTTSSGPTSTTVTTTIPQPSPKRESRGREISPVRDQPKHVPIVIKDYISNPDEPTPIAELPAATSTRSISPLPRSNTPKSMDSNSGQNVKKRAAFLNGEIEKGDGLIRSKPAAIVRPFEHASNAFTRLFKQKEGSKDEEDTPFGDVVKRKSSKESGLLSGTGLRGMGSSSSLKGMMSRDTKDEKRDSGGAKSSRHSGVSSAGSKKATITNSRPSGERMEYGDLARWPTPKSEESRSRRSTFGSRKSPKVPKDRSAMEYGDMVRMPEFDRQEAENRIRSKSLGRESRPKSSAKHRSTMGYGDLIAMPAMLRKSEDGGRRAKDRRPGTPKQKDVERAKAKEALEQREMPRIPDQDVPALPSSGGLSAVKQQPDYLAAALEPTRSKRTSRQNITALPSLQPSADPDTREASQPSGPSSPFYSPIELEPQGPDFPEDWPLSNEATPLDTPSPTKGVGPEAGILAVAIEDGGNGFGETKESRREPTFGANVFDRQFVQTIPAQPVKRPMSRDIGPEEREILFKDAAPVHPGSGEVIPQMDSDDEDDGAILWTSKSDRDRSFMKTGVSNTSRRLDWQESPPRPALRKQDKSARRSLPRPVSMVEEAEEKNSSSAGESEEEFGIKRRSDNAAGYFGGARVAQARKIVNSSSASPRGVQRTSSNPPVSPGYLRLRIPIDEASDAPVAQATEERPDGLFRRASTASIESHPRSELKSIEILRRSSVEIGRGSAPVTPMESTRPSMEAPSSTGQSPASPLQYKGGITFPSPPSVPPRASSLRSSPQSDVKATSKSDSNRSVPKRKQGAGRNEMLSSPRKELRPGEDNFDRHVSEVLDRVHAPIRFRTRPGAETPQTLSSRTSRLPKAGERAAAGKNMTLAPAELSPRKATPADPEVKLYHLTQAGRTEPIKLYVRLVGEGERVMVRVGGGWADLAEYLRQYAEHHGSRTVSEGTLELQTASASAGGLPSAKRTFSGPPYSSVEPKSLSREALLPAKSPVTPLISPLARPRTRDSERSWLEREQPEFSMGDSGDEGEDLSPSVAHGGEIAPPRRSSLLSSSRPSTSQSLRHFDSAADAVASSPLAGPGAALSLAGPSKAKPELPEQKARWVEGMIQQVSKSASAEKNREEKERFVAEMGRVGGVRRVAFRSASGAAGGG